MNFDALEMSDDSGSVTDFDPMEEAKMRKKAKAPAASPRPSAPTGPGLFRRAGKLLAGAIAGAPPAAPAEAARSNGIRVSVAAGEHSPADGAVLFDSASGGAGQFTFLSVAFADKGVTADAIDPELTLLLFVGDLAAPRARVKLADVLRQGGRRPLNIRRDANQPVRLVLEDPNGAWGKGVPAMEIVLGVA